MNNHTGALHLDSDAGPEDDSYWAVKFKNGKMSWRSKGSEFAREFVITYRQKA